MRLAAALLALVACATVARGGIVLVHSGSSGFFDVVEVEVPFGRLAPGSTVGANSTNASVSVGAALLSTTTDALYLNNTNATGAYYARLVAYSTSGIANLVTLEIGIDNGTRTEQVVASLGSLTQSSGSYVKLEPGSTNTIYVTNAVTSLLAADSVIRLDVYAAESESGGTFTKTQATVAVVT